MELNELDKIAEDVIADLKNRELSIREALYVFEMCKLDILRADADIQNPFSVKNLRKAGFGKKEVDKHESSTN